MNPMIKMYLLGLATGIIASVAVYVIRLLIQPVSSPKSDDGFTLYRTFPGGAADIDSLMQARDHFPPKER